MKMTKLFFVSLFSFLLLFIQGACIEINEVVQMKENGSALLNLSIFVPDIEDKKGSTNVKSKNPADIAKSLAEGDIDNIKFLGEQEKKMNGLNQVSLNFELSSLKDSVKLYQKIEEAEKANPEKKESDKNKAAFDKIFSQSRYEIKKDKSGTITISREFKPTPDLLKKASKKQNKKDPNDFSNEMGDMGDLFVNMIYVSFEFFSPTEIISSNAQQQFGNNLRWKTSLGYLMKNKMTMEIKIKSSPALEKMIK